MHVLYNKQNMDDLAAEAVGLGRQVAERAKALHLGDTAKDVAFVSRCLARLKDRQPFDEGDEGGFDAVTDILERSIASEFLAVKSGTRKPATMTSAHAAKLVTLQFILIAAMN